ncbi:hypothetical protein [Cryobacterium psychrophilum]|uniref:Uncharacterized protein n=1 Tax=Cryobacterium psychrophilum TaxID=41988 RepID=A0A4Y8KSZ0_9MICO|nr:hypothetical protein [Cryobacterium psychrophilum]TFD80540.1 hypothetical protein E3T53_05560 [Cryobacterium psychrophilum]
MTDITPTADTENTVVIDDVMTTTEGVQDSHPPVEDPETFPREYVEDLRKENGKYRTRAQQADDLAARLHTALVTATGRLQDPTDLVFDEAHLTDGASLTAAVDALLVSKPHLASRKTFGNIGQGASTATDTFSLSGALRSNAS